MDTSLELQQDSVKEDSLSARRSLGVFYTPVNVAELLCKWAVRSPVDRVLEPSFGGCGFLSAAATALAELGQGSPYEQIHGCDIDKAAFAYLNAKAPAATIRNFIEGDFLSLARSDFGGVRFDAVVGNPPYISNEKFSSQQRQSVVAWNKVVGSGLLKGKPSLWAYFVVHGASFLRPGGRMAWILPGSFLTAHYAMPLRQWLVETFARSIAISVTERLFVNEGTEESTVILLADGFGKGGENGRSGLTWTTCDQGMDALRVIKAWDIGSSFAVDASDRAIGTETRKVLDGVLQRFNAQKISDFASVTIGLVAGDTPFFIRRASEWRQESITNSCLVSLAPKSKWLKGIQLSSRDMLRYQELDVPCLMFSPRILTAGAKRLIENYPKGIVESNATYKKRSCWYKPDDGKIPDLLGVFMTQLNPRLILNLGGVNCTNSYYRVNILNRKRHRMIGRLLSISMQTSVAQLVAELCGRVRGSGALKLEPSEYKALPVFVKGHENRKDIVKVFEAINNAITLGDDRLATQLADRFIFGKAGVSAEFNKLRVELIAIRSRRLRENTVL